VEAWRAWTRTLDLVVDVDERTLLRKEVVPLIGPYSNPRVQEEIGRLHKLVFPS